MEATPVDLVWRRSRLSLSARFDRFRALRWQIVQCALAAGVAWFIAKDALGHDVPIFAPIAAVVSLGTSYAQRLRRVAEVTAGVAVGVFVGDLLVMVRHKPGIRQMAELVDPLDRALRSTRVMVRQVAVAAYRRRPVPHSYAVLARDLADAVDLVAAELTRTPAEDGMAEASRTALLAVGAGSGLVERSEEMTAEVVLAQLRSVIVDLLMLTGMGQLEATDALPPPPRK